MNNLYTISQFSKKVNVSPSTLRRWDKTGEFKAKKHKSGHRYYDESDVRSLLNLTPLEDRKIVVYCRVSSHNQKDDLESQVKSMESYCSSNGIKIDELIKEIGGGMNFKRKKFLELMDDVAKGKILKILIAHKDRFSRFGFDYFNHVCAVNGCELEVINQESLSPEKEMVEDLLAIVHTFSCRLYGLRSYKKTLKKALENESNS
ncbi:MAG: IS607 family transposase [Methylococcaceae bacterium]|nr:IS607 family transposase [Methylococcaceae bacterium]